MAKPRAAVTREQVILLAAEWCLSHQKIAEMLNCSARTVARRLYGKDTAVRVSKRSIGRWISKRNAEVLSYLQGLGPVGIWVQPRSKHMVDDLGMNHAQVCGHLNQLVHQGFIERHGPRMERQYRVLVRLETPGVHEGNTHLWSASQKRAHSRRRWAVINARQIAA